MRFREHRSTLAESMETLVELPDRHALVRHIEDLHASYRHGFDFSKIDVQPYFMERDVRCGWPETHIVLLGGYGVLGFTDTPA